MIFNQQEFDIRLEWGLQGLKQLAPISDVIIIVDVLSFSTCVDIATSNGALIYPYQWKDETALAYAQKINGQLASFDRTSTGRYSLSPASLRQIKVGTKLVLPSPNGSTLSLHSDQSLTLCGCLRNAQAVAEYAQQKGTQIGIIPAGEKWPDGSIRFALEDFVGAGSILAYIKGIFSPECKIAISVFKDVQQRLLQTLRSCSSGKELISRGFQEDVNLAGQLNISKTIPTLNQDFYKGLHPDI